MFRSLVLIFSVSLVSISSFAGAQRTLEDGKEVTTLQAVIDLTKNPNAHVEKCADQELKQGKNGLSLKKKD